MIVVHHLENSRSQRLLWLLEELEFAYEIRRYARDPRTMLAPPELARVHPLGKSPLIEDEGRVIAETGAIVEYLVDKAEGRMGPPPNREAAPRLSGLTRQSSPGSPSTNVSPSSSGMSWGQRAYRTRSKRGR